MQAAVSKHDKIMQAEAKKQNRQNEASKKQRRKPESSAPSKRNPSPAKSKKGSNKDSKMHAKHRQSPGSKAKPQGKGTSLVLMVNELLKEANEQTKKDFSQGIVYADPDAKLKAIYDREKQGNRVGVPPLPSSRRSVDGDLLTTIKKRQGEVNGVAAKKKRSQLERVIDCINCASDAEDMTESPSGSSYGTLSVASDHSSMSISSSASQTANGRPVNQGGFGKSSASIIAEPKAPKKVESSDRSISVQPKTSKKTLVPAASDPKTTPTASKDIDSSSTCARSKSDKLTKPKSGEQPSRVVASPKPSGPKKENSNNKKDE